MVYTDSHSLLDNQPQTNLVPHFAPRPQVLRMPYFSPPRCFFTVTKDYWFIVLKTFAKNYNIITSYSQYSLLTAIISCQKPIYP